MISGTEQDPKSPIWEADPVELAAAAEVVVAALADADDVAAEVTAAADDDTAVDAATADAPATETVTPVLLTSGTAAKSVLTPNMALNASACAPVPACAAAALLVADRKSVV